MSRLTFSGLAIVLLVPSDTGAKLRSMRVDLEETNRAVFFVENDDRVTTVNSPAGPISKPVPQLNRTDLWFTLSALTTEVQRRPLNSATRASVGKTG